MKSFGPSLGSRLLRSWRLQHPLGTFSLRDVGRILGITGAGVAYLESGTTPSVVLAFAIQDATEGAVPAVAWTRTPETDPATVGVVELGATPGEAA